jgi:Cu(I)/Ag(I) efflux system membrane protein CusA/SilA
MLGRIISACIANRGFAAIVFALILGAGVFAMKRTGLDAIPDLSDIQVIVFTEYPGQDPRVVEDQVTYPLTTALLSVPFAKVVRGYSFFGYSFVYIIFEDGTDMYWARSRVLEYLNYVSGRLPAGVTPALGPDATGVGWVYEYVLDSKDHDLAQLRSIQDWYLRYELQTVPGVSEVASVGGFVKQYQITLDPDKLLAYDIPLSTVKRALERSNQDVGGRLLELAETEFMIRGRGYLRSIEDIELIPVGVTADHVPIRMADIADVAIGPELRRGIVEWTGEGETVGGIVIMRYGENAYRVIQDVKERLMELAKTLPEGVEIHTAYDRSSLIERAVETLREKLVEETIVVGLVCLVFLLHVRSALVAIATLPAGIILAFLIMKIQGVSANIMSLGGIAIAIGAMVDAAIVMIENMHKHLERDDGTTSRWVLAERASKEVGPSLFFSLLIIAVSFLPVFALQAQEGRLFRPLAYTKTYAMAGAAILSVTLVPLLMGLFIRGRIRSESENPVNRALVRIYRPVLLFALGRRRWILGAALLLLVTSVIPARRLGSEFMPPLNEGDLLYMPSMLPGISITTARQLLQETDRIIKSFPEVEYVFGKIGRAETATDPASLSMIETIVALKPEKQWRPGMTTEKLIDEMNAAIQLPGVTNAWTMPIKTRIDMLSTGIKTPVGIKIAGPDLEVLSKIGEQVEAILQGVPGTASVYAERVTGGNFLDIEIDREQTLRYGLTVGDVQDVIKSAIGGMNVTSTVEGLERYPVNIRYGRELRDDLTSLKRVQIPTPMGHQIALSQVADLRFLKGPPVIKSEGARPNAWVYVDVEGSDLGGYVSAAQQAVASQLTMPPGYRLIWSGQYEYMVRAKQRLQLILPITLMVVFMLLYANFRSIAYSAMVMITLPLSLVGGIWFIYFLGYNMSVAVGVGFIALAGVAAEIGVVLIMYLKHALDEVRSAGDTGLSHADLRRAIIKGTIERVRPIMMTVTAVMAGLLPILWGHGTGASVMKRIAAPMIGGMVSAAVLTLVVIPLCFQLWHEREVRTRVGAGPSDDI